MTQIVVDALMKFGTPGPLAVLQDATFVEQVISPTTEYESIAGAGTVQGDAAALSATRPYHQITGANGTVGWRLPTTTADMIGKTHYLFCTTSGVAKIWPATGGTINGGATNAAHTATTGIKTIFAYCTAANTWVVA